MENDRKYSLLEVCRGVAALMVVLFHYHFYAGKYLGNSPAIARIFEGGHSGVEFFFVLSGFIIYTVHRNDIGFPLTILSFLRKRAIRILPMYWLVITISVSLFFIVPGWGVSKGLTVRNIIFDYFLLPTGSPLVLAPSWTLKSEALFYGFFSLIILRPVLGVGLFFLWNFSIVVINALAMIQGWRVDEAHLVYLLDIHQIGFGVGILCAWTCSSSRSVGLRNSQLMLCLGLAAIAGLMTFEAVENLNFSELQRFSEKIWLSFSYTLVYALVIVACVYLERANEFRCNKNLLLFGASSYTLYLIHDPLLSMTGKLAARYRAAEFIDENILYIFGVGLAVGTAVLLHVTVERPVTKRLKALVKGRAGHNRIANIKGPEDEKTSKTPSAVRSSI